MGFLKGLNRRLAVLAAFGMVTVAGSGFAQTTKQAKAPAPTPAAERGPSNVDLVNKALNPGPTRTCPCRTRTWRIPAGIGPFRPPSHRFTVGRRMAGAFSGSKCRSRRFVTERADLLHIVVTGRPYRSRFDGPLTRTVALPPQVAHESPCIGRFPCTSQIVVCIFPAGVGDRPQPRQHSSVLN